MVAGFPSTYAIKLGEGVSFMNGPESGWGRASLKNCQAKKALRFQSLPLLNYFLTGEDLFILLPCQK
jgi:hypothetical protein